MIHIVLFEPEIPQNTGNIMRTCVGINATLHLIKPLGFDLSDAALRRAHLDYLKYVKYFVYESYLDFLDKTKASNICYITRYGYKNYEKIVYNNIEDDIYLMFGKESTGIEKSILASNIEHTYRIPTTANIRSLNLANCVAIVSYEVLRKVGYIGLEEKEPVSLKGPDFLEKIKGE